MKQLSIKYGLYFAWMVSLISTILSLIMSELYHYLPCSLCWIQRIFMFPLTFILGVATYYGDKKVVKYVLPLATAGGSIAFYHYLYQEIPGLSRMTTCSPDIPCNQDHLNWFGFITIPLLSFISFIFILFFTWMGSKKTSTTANPL